MFYVGVTDSMRTGQGGGNPEEGEMIEIVEISVKESMNLLTDETKEKSVGLLFSLIWFQKYKLTDK